MKKTTRIFSILLIAAMLLGLLALTASAAGTEPPLKNGYYEISTAEHLVWFADQVNNKSKREYNAKLMADIDLSTVCSETLGSWDPIYGYKGIFDGNGKEIKNLYVANQGTNGFIGRLEGENAQVLNLTVRGVVYADQYAGGIVGDSTKGKIENCTSYVDIYATGDKDFRIGGIIGYCGSESSIINCWNYGDLNAAGTSGSQNIYMGGIAGYVSQNVTIDRCANYGKISTEGTTVNAEANLGGIVGMGYDNTVISNCYNQGEVHLIVDSDQWSTIGGILGNAARAMTIRNTFSNAVVHKTVTRNIQHDIGALVGDAYTVTIENCFWNSDKTTLSANGKTAIVNLTNVAGHSAATLATGEAAYHLGEAWGQKIGTDAVPVLGGMKVYQNAVPASVCSNPSYVYANTQGAAIAHDMTLGAEVFTDGVCNNCGYVCTHPTPAFTYSNLTNTTHDATYNCCNKTLTAVAHAFSQTGLCPCGAQAVATVDGAYYLTFDEAIAAAVAAQGSTLKVLADVERDRPIIIDSGNFTIDLAGKTLKSNGYTIDIRNSGTKITIINSTQEMGSVISTASSSAAVVIMDGAEAAIWDGNYQGDDAVRIESGNSSATIYGGVFVSTGERTVTNRGSLRIEGGSFTAGDWSAVTAGSISVNTTIIGGSLTEGIRGHMEYWGGTLELTQYGNIAGIRLTSYSNEEIPTDNSVVKLPEGYYFYDATGKIQTKLVYGAMYTVNVCDHSYENGVCTLCGDLCAHSYDATGLCALCNIQAVASVTLGDTTEYYLNLTEAFNAANGKTATIRLLADMANAITGRISSGVITLDLNGKIWESEAWVLNISGDAQMTILDTAQGGGLRGVGDGYPAIVLKDSAALEVAGGTLEHTATQSTIMISNSGKANEASLLVSGGKITGVTRTAIYAKGASVTVTGGVLEKGISYVAGLVDLSGCANPAGILIENMVEEDLVVDTHLKLPKDYYLCDEFGEIITTIPSWEIGTVSYGADLSEDMIQVQSLTYNGKTQIPQVTVTVGGKTLVAGTDFEIVPQEDMITVGTYQITVKGLNAYRGEVTVDVTIGKANLLMQQQPEASYFYGENHEDKTITGGKVVLEGADDQIIPGTWTWVAGTGTAIFTPDEAYASQVNELAPQAVLLNVSAATPVIEVVTPSPAMGPGQRIRMSVLVKNPYNEELTDLPTAFRLTYKIGENGTPVTVDGLEFTLPADILLGEKVYVTVENLAVEGKYVAATSVNTIEILVGQVDYTAQIKALEEQIAQLKADHDADVSTLEAELEALRQQLAALDNGYATDEELAKAVETLNETISALTQRVTDLENTYATKAALEKAKADLEAAIATNSGDIAELEAAIANLETALTEAIERLENADETNRNVLSQMIAEARATLQAAITALENRMAAAEENITQLRAALDAAVKALNEAIDANSGDIADLKAAVTALEDALSRAIEELTDLIRAAEAAAKSYADEQDATLKKALETKIDEAKAALKAAIEALENRMAAAEENITQLRAALDAAVKALNEAIAANSGDIADLKVAVDALEQALSDAIEELKGLIRAAEAAAKTYADEQDATLKKVLETKIDEAKAALEAALAALEERVEKNETDIAALQAALAKAIEELNDAIAAGDKANADALKKAVEELTELLNEAVADLEKADKDNRADLEALIQTARETLEAAIAQLRQDLENAVEELENADQANAEALAQAIKDLSAAIEAAEAAAAAEDAAIRGELAAAKAALEKSIAILRNELYAVRGELLTTMNEKDAVLSNKIAELAAALDAAIAASQAADEALKAELTAAIEAAEATLNAAIEKVAEELDSMYRVLTYSIAVGDKALHSRVDDLTAALNEAIAASEAADGALRTELNSRINEAVAALNAAIEQVQKNLDEAVVALNAKDARQDQTITIALVIASLGVAGCLALAIVIIVDKRKRA